MIAKKRVRRVLKDLSRWTFLRGDMRKRLRLLPDNSVDSIVTDPPYGLGFMGKGWDHGVPGAEFWSEVLRVLKPGGYAVVFGGTRTFHRLGVALEDAGFEIRDCLSWMYGQGFPKSMDVEKAVDAHIRTGKSDSKQTGNGKARDRSGQHRSEFPKRGGTRTPFVSHAKEAAARSSSSRLVRSPARNCLTFTSEERIISRSCWLTTPRSSTYSRR